MRPASIQPCAARATASSGGRVFSRPLPCPAAIAAAGPGAPARAPSTRRRSAPDRARRRPMAPARRRRWTGVANGPPACRPGSRRSRRTRPSASATARSPSAIASNGGSAQSGGSAGPAKVCGRLRATGADRGERGAGGEAGGAEREIERVDPGMGVGEPAGGLGGGHAGAQAVAHRVGRRGGAGVEPGERVGGVAQRDEQAGQRGAGQPGVRAGWRCRPDRGLGRRCRSRSASVSSGVSCQDGRSRSASSSASPNGLFARHRRRFPKPLVSLGQHDRSAPIRARSVRDFGGFRRPARTAHGRVRPGKRVPSDNPALRTENRRFRTLSPSPSRQPQRPAHG